MMTKIRNIKSICFLLILYVFAAISLIFSIEKAAAAITIIIPVYFFLLTFMAIFSVLRKLCDLSESAA